MKLNCLLVDDEPLAIQVLQTHIDNIPSLQVIGSCNNAFEAINFLKDHKVDLLFLDIQMPKLMGHQFLQTLRNAPKVIFTTAYKEYALDAFELDAVDYLLKPVTLERLVKAVNKITETPTSFVQEEAIIEDQGFIYFRAERKMVKVNYEDIIYIESMKDYIKIVRTSGKPLLVKQSIGALEDVLPQNLFVRIHRSYIVSLKKITAYTNHDVEINSLEIPIGRLYTPNISRMLEKTEIKLK